MVVEPGQPPRSPARVIGSAMLANLLNPKLTVFFFAFLPQFVPAHAPHEVERLLLLSGVFMAMTFVVFVIYGLRAPPQPARDRHRAAEGHPGHASSVRGIIHRLGHQARDDLTLTSLRSTPACVRQPSRERLAPPPDQPARSRGAARVQGLALGWSSSSSRGCEAV